MITVILKSNLNKPSNDAETLTMVSHGITYRLAVRSRAWRPPTDIYETEDRFIVVVEVAGMRESDFVVSLDRNLLTISGVRPNVFTDERRAFHQIEIPFGEFSTAVELPLPVDSDKVTATYENGFLRIDLPKQKPKPIEILTQD